MMLVDDFSAVLKRKMGLDSGSIGAAAVERAVQLSHEKYCSASAMLAKTAELGFTVDIVDTQAQA